MTTESHVPSGYELNRDDAGLTEQERQMRGLLRGGSSVSAAAAQIGVTRQRGHQLATALVRKGAMRKEGQKYADVVAGE